MTNDVLQTGEKRMKAAIEATKKAFSAIRTGRANTGLLDRITVDYYGVSTPLNQLASISVPDPRLIVIQPYDKSTIKDIDRAIQASDIDLMPTNDGTVLRLAIPQLTEERRKQLVKVVKKEAEDKRVAVRNVRRDLNDEIRKMEKAGDISEDESRGAQDEVQELTDKYIAVIDELTESKEEEILEI